MIRSQKILLIITLLLLPFGELIRFDIGNNIAIKPIDLTCGLLFITWLATIVYTRQFKRINSHDLKILVLFPLIGLFSLLINTIWLTNVELLVAFLYLLRWVSYASIFFIVQQFDKGFQKVIYWLFLIDGLIVLGAGYAQYFFYNSLKNIFYLGWDEHMYRLVSTFLDPNFSGAFLALYIFFIGGIVWYERKKGNSRMNIFLISVLILSILAVFLTFSRSALLMLIVGVFVFAILIQKKKFFFLFLAAIVLFALVASPKFYVENMNLFRINSSVARFDNYQMAVTIFQDHPIIGVGFNTYRYAKQLYGHREVFEGVPSHADAGVDNSYLFVLATTGIFGFGAFLWLCQTIIKKVNFFYKKQTSVFPLIVLVSLISLSVNAIFINSLFFPAIMLWMWTLLGLAIKK